MCYKQTHAYNTAESDLAPPHNESTVSDDRVDWSKTFPGIEQPNEAYSLVLNKNIAYEQTKKPQRQRDKKRHRHPPTTKGSTETAKMQYENIPSHSTLDECLFKETILPSDTAQTLSGPATEMKLEEAEETAKTEYENTRVAQCSETQQTYENVCPPNVSAPHSAYVNVDI